MALITGENFYGLGVGQGAELAELPSVLYPHADPARRARPAGVHRTKTIAAFVSEGRWMVACPFCPSAQVAFEHDHRFFCAGPDGCGNQAAGGKYVKVVWPEKRAEIERLLRPRPPAARNWIPGETTASLAAENAQYLGGN